MPYSGPAWHNPAEPDAKLTPTCLAIVEEDGYDYVSTRRVVPFFTFPDGFIGPADGWVPTRPNGWVPTRTS